MADRMIQNFATLGDAHDDDLLLVSSDEETYNIKVKTLKDAVKGDADRAEAAAVAARESAASASQKANTAVSTANEAMQKADAAQTATAAAQTAAESAQASATAASRSASAAANSASAAALDAATAKEDVAGLISDVDDIKSNLEDVSIDVDDLGLEQDMETNIVYPTYKGRRSTNGIPIAGSGGSGGGGDTGSQMTFSLLSPASMVVLETAGSALVHFKFSSVDRSTGAETGDGTLAISVGGVLKDTKTVSQGDDVVVDLWQWLVTGKNSVSLTMTDSYTLTATRKISITKDTFSLDWSLGRTAVSSGDLTVYLTPTGNGEKKLYLQVDNEDPQMQTVTITGRRVPFTVSMADGAHTIKAWGEMVSGGSTMNSPVLTCAVIQTSAGSDQISIVANIPDSVEQFSTLSAAYRVVDPDNNPATVEFWINGSKYDEATVDQSEHVFTYRPTIAGTLPVSFICRGAAYSKTVNIPGLNVDVQEVSDSLECKLDASTVTSLENWTFNGVTLTLSEGFDTHNGGLTTDKKGIKCIRVTKGDRLTINHKLFGKEARTNGREFKIVYAVENSTRMDAVAISCMNGGIGMEIQANAVQIGSEGTSISYPTCEGYKAELDFCVEPRTGSRLMMLWEKGTPCAAKRYPADDNWQQASAVGVTVGSDECDVLLYLYRCYGRSLTKDEIKANFIVDGEDAAEIKSRDDRNRVYNSAGRLDPDLVAEKNPGLHVLTWHAPALSTGKEMTVNGYVTHRYVSGGPRHEWTAQGVKQKAQGTSSLDYIKAGNNEDFNFVNGFDLADGTHVDTYSMTDASIGVNYLNYKTNVASQEHTNNILLSDWINTHQPYIRPARAANPKVRDTIEGHMAVMFFHNTGENSVVMGPYTVLPDETVFYSLGCLNNSKKNNEVFGMSAEDDAYCIEIRDNDKPPCKFKSADLSKEDWSGDMYFEFRYLAPGVSQDEAVANIQRLLDWMVSVDATQPTNATLPGDGVTINGVKYTADTAEYRRAKFEAEFDNYWISDSVAYHDVYTLAFSQIDNRGKNVFFAWSKKAQKWHLNFAYDNDTGLGNDNVGGLTLRAGYLDTDKVGGDSSKDVFNCADSVLFTMYREVFPTRIRDMYIRLENDGAWDLSGFADHCDEVQSLACESIWIEDAFRKSVDTLTGRDEDSKIDTTYISMLVGKKRLQRRNFLYFQQAFMSSYFVSNYAVADNAIIRGHAPDTYIGVTPRAMMTITAYCHLFISVSAGSETHQVRAAPGESKTLEFSDYNVGSDNMGDTVISIRNASMLRSLGPLAQLYPGYINVSACERITTLEIGSSISGYKNENMTGINVENSKNLEYFQIEGCSKFVSPLDFSKNIYLKEIYTRGSGATGVSFADWGRLVTARLNAVASIYAHNLHYVSTFTLESPTNLTSLNIDDSDGIDTYALAEGATGIQRVRLIGIDWQVPASAYDALLRLHNAIGIDDDGLNTNHGVVTGRVHFTTTSSEKYNNIRSLMSPDVSFSYDQLLDEYTVTFQNYDGTFLYSAIVEAGGSVADPVANGTIPKPTHAADEAYSYTYYAWDKPLTNITADTVLTAQYITADKYYRVLWVDRDGTVLQENTVKAHGSCSYQGSDLASDDSHIWVGWKDTPGDVVSDMTIQADYVTPVLPAAAKDMSLYDYAFSENPTDSMAYFRDEFAGIVKSSKFKNYLAAGDKIKIVPQGRTITNASLTYKVTGFNHFRIANTDAELESEDGAFAKIALAPTSGVGPARALFNETTNAGGYIGSNIDNFCVELEDILSPFMRSLVPSVVIRANAGNSGGATAEIKKARRKFFLYSIGELGYLTTTAPYNKEVDTGAESTQMQYFTSNDNRKIGVDYWSRSAKADGSVAFWYCNNTGSVSYTYAVGDTAKAVPAGICLS